MALWKCKSRLVIFARGFFAWVFWKHTSNCMLYVMSTKWIVWKSIWCQELTCGGGLIWKTTFFMVPLVFVEFVIVSIGCLYLGKSLLWSGACIHSCLTFHNLIVEVNSNQAHGLYDKHNHGEAHWGLPINEKLCSCWMEYEMWRRGAFQDSRLWCQDFLRPHMTQWGCCLPQ